MTILHSYYPRETNNSLGITHCHNGLLLKDRLLCADTDIYFPQKDETSQLLVEPEYWQ